MVQALCGTFAVAESGPCKGYVDVKCDDGPWLTCPDGSGIVLFECRVAVLYELCKVARGMGVLQTHMEKSTNTSVTFVSKYEEAAFDYFHNLQEYALGIMDYAQNIGLSSEWFTAETDEAANSPPDEAEESSGNN